MLAINEVNAAFSAWDVVKYFFALLQAWYREAEATNTGKTLPVDFVYLT
jgi:hypothetical protein